MDKHHFDTNFWVSLENKYRFIKKKLFSYFFVQANTEEFNLFSLLIFTKSRNKLNHEFPTILSLLKFYKQVVYDF